MNKEALIAVCGGLVSAFFAMGYLTGRPSGVLFSLMSTLPLYILGLMYGLNGVSIAGAVGLLVVGVTQGVAGGFVYAFNAAMPAGLVTYLALRSQIDPQGKIVWYPGGYIVSWLTVMFSTAFVIWAAFVAGDGVAETIRLTLDEAFSIMWPVFPEDQKGQLSSLLSTIFPAMVAMVWIMTAVVSGVVGQKMLMRMKRNLRPMESLAVLELPYWLTSVLVGASALALIGSGDSEYIGTNLTIIFTIPYVCMGLAVVHMYARRVSHPRMLLTAFYVVVFVLGWPIVLLVGVGLIEQWVGLRKRFAGPDDWELNG